MENEERIKQAKEKNVILMPGAGFDVVPTDCLAKKLQEAFAEKYGNEQATSPSSQIELVINTGADTQMSRGTLKSSINILRQGTWGFPERVGGVIKSAPITVKEFDFDGKKRICTSVPWGDIATAYVSTGVPNIRVYFSGSKHSKTWATIMNIWLFNMLFFLFFNIPLVVPFLFKLVDWFLPRGPEEKESTRVQILGSLTQGDKQVWGRAVTTAGYLFTSESTLLAALKILTGDGLKVKSGCVTPSLVFGSNYVEEIDGCSVKITSQ